VVVDEQDSDEQVTDFSEVTIRVDHVPRNLTQVVVVEQIRIAITVLSYVVDHHFLEVRFGHPLQTSLEPEPVSVASSNGPQVVNVSLLLCFAHL